MCESARIDEGKIETHRNCVFLGHVSREQKLHLLKKVKENATQYSLQSYSSNVVEAAISCPALAKKGKGTQKARSWVDLDILEATMEIHREIFFSKDGEVSGLHTHTLIPLPGRAQLTPAPTQQGNHLMALLADGYGK